MHDKVVEVLKAALTYHHPYRAATAYDKRVKIPQLCVHTLAACTRGDMLSVYLEELAALVPGGRRTWLAGTQTPEAARATADVLSQVFASVDDRPRHGT